MRSYFRLSPFLAVLAALSLVIVANADSSKAGANVRLSNADFFPSDPYASTVGGPADVLQQNEPHIAQSPVNPLVMAAGMNDVRTLAETNDAWQSLAVSTDGGATWGQEQLVRGWKTDPGCPSISPACGTGAGSDPVLGFDTRGHLFFSFIGFQRTPPGQPGFMSEDANALVVARYNVSTTGTLSYDKSTIVERGTVGLGRQEDKEWLVADNTGGAHEGNLYVCWARFTGAQDHLIVSRSTDAGDSWAAPTVIDNGTLMQGCQVVVAPDGTLYVFYRKIHTSRFTTPANFNAVFVVKSTDGGITFSEPRLVSSFVDYAQISSRTIPSFRTHALPSAAADANGVYVAWQVRNATTGADVQVAFSHDGGATWTKLSHRPHQDASPHLGHQIMPAISAAGGKLSIIWYDSRSEPAFNPRGPITGSDDDDGPGCNGDPDPATPAAPQPDDTVPGCGMDVYYNQISTSGLNADSSWGTELRLTDGSWNPNLWGSIRALTPFIGDYISVVADGSDAFAVWADNRDINAERQRCDAGEDPAAGQCEDAVVSTNPPALINARSRDSNVYFQKITK